jgi:hypothetical protein
LKKSHTSSILKKPNTGSTVIIVKKEQIPIKKVRAKSTARQRNVETQKIYSSQSVKPKRAKSGNINIKRKKSVLSNGSKVSQKSVVSRKTISAPNSMKSKSPKRTIPKSKSPKPASNKSLKPASIKSSRPAQNKSPKPALNKSPKPASNKS